MKRRKNYNKEKGKSMHKTAAPFRLSPEEQKAKAKTNNKQVQKLAFCLLK